MKVLSFLLIAMSAFTPCLAGEDHLQYYAVFVDGQKIGYATRLRQVAKGKVTTVENAVMTITRMNQSVALRQSETCIETAQGHPLGFSSIQDLGTVSATINGTVTADGKVHVTSSTFGQQQTRTVDWPEGAILAEGLRLLSIKKGLKEGTTYGVTLFVPSMMQAVECRVTVGKKQEVDLLGRIVTLTEVSTSLQLPGVQIDSTGYVDEDFRPLKTVTPTMMGMTIEMVACDKAFALSENDVVDFLAKTILTSPTPLVGLADARSATYRLKPTGPKKLEGMIGTDSQRVRGGKDGSVTLIVRPAKAPAGVKFPYKGTDPAALNALKPTRYLQSDDKRVIALARQAVGGESDAAKAARKIETFVGRYVTKKNLSVGYASAAEVAASRQGDCSEHAVLTAAMCRSVGIPARIVAGYVYTPKLAEKTDIFVAHAWVQARLGRKWIGLDATRGGTAPGHIALVIGDGEPADFLGMLNTMGYFKIEKVTIRK